MAKRVTVGVLPADYRRLTALCAKTGQTITAVVDRALKLWFETEAPVFERAAAEIEKQAKNRTTR